MYGMNADNRIVPQKSVFQRSQTVINVQHAPEIA